MSKDRDSNYVSVGFWMFAMFITAIPIVGLIMIIVWAFFGENESRKNYFKAILVWFGVIILLAVTLMLIGASPAVLKQIQDWTHRA